MIQLGKWVKYIKKSLLTARIQADLLLLSACAWWKYTKLVFHIFSQVMHFIVAWLCAVRKGKGTGYPTPFNSWLSTPRSGGVGCAVHGHVCVCVCARASGAGTVWGSNQPSG
jgi:hypothetical protein